jgi:hypothetical protein
MRKSVTSMGAVIGALLVSPLARAHQFTCEKTVNGTNYVELSSYPATLTYAVNVTNVAEEPSEALAVSDNLAASLGYSFELATPFTLDIGASVSDSYDVVLDTEQACLELDAADGSADGRIDNVFQVSWESGAAQCWATVMCAPPAEQPPTTEPPPESPPPSGATRTPGFYKTHEQALTACLDQGPITLGSLTIDSLEAALGLLWSSPAAYDSGEHRSRIDRTRFQLARHALVATCNQRLFGTTTDPEDLLAQASAALLGTDCALMQQLKDALDAFNNSGDEVAFPEGFDAGAATPREASAMAVDPTAASADQCGGEATSDGGAWAADERGGRPEHAGKSRHGDDDDHADDDDHDDEMDDDEDCDHSDAGYVDPGDGEETEDGIED